MRFPPLVSRAHYERMDHMETFPNLMGSVHTFMGTDRDHLELMRKRAVGEDWSAALRPTEVMMTPAACYPLYPTATGVLPQEGRTVDLRSFVFRHEPSIDPARMQIFRMHEYVRLGTPAQALGHRDDWLERGQEMLVRWASTRGRSSRTIPSSVAAVSVMAATQKEQSLKYELVVPIASAEKLTAIASCNYHLDHFGQRSASRRRTARSPTRRASASASSASRWPCSRRTGSTRGGGRATSSRCSRYDETDPPDRSPDVLRHPIHGEDRIWVGDELLCRSSGSSCCTRWASIPWRRCPSRSASTSRATSGRSSSSPLADLYDLYGLEVQELAIWRPLADHVEEQVPWAAGRWWKLDSFFLPDTAGTAYRNAHVKIDRGRQRDRHRGTVSRLFSQCRLSRAARGGLRRSPARAGTAGVAGRCRRTWSS